MVSFLTSGDNSVPLPMLDESMKALDEWTEMIAYMSENDGSSMATMLDFLDRIDDLVDFETASVEDRAALAAEIGFPAFVELTKEMSKTKRSLGLLGM